MPAGSTWRKSKSRSSPNSVSTDDSRHSTMSNATPLLGHATATENAPRSTGPSAQPMPVVYSQNSTGPNLLDDLLGLPAGGPGGRFDFAVDIDVGRSVDEIAVERAGAANRGCLALVFPR